MKELKVYYKQNFAGVLQKDQAEQFHFIYDQSYLDSDFPSLSLSLPKEQKTFTSDGLFHFFDGLIPEGWLLKLATEKFKYNPLRDRFELLEKLCANSIGAVHIGVKSKYRDEMDSFESGENDYSKMSYKKCLICYEECEELFHDRCSRKVFGRADISPLNIGEQELKKLAYEQISKKLAVSGVQKKLSLDFDDDGNTKQKSARLTVTDLWGRFIFKPRGLAPHYPENEHLCMKLAELSGIAVEKCALIPTKNGELGFIARRFDRGKKREEFHQEDFCQILEKETFKKYSGSIEQIGKVLKNYSDFPGDNLYRLLELTVFNFLIGNVDAHLKNFSLSYEGEKGPRIMLTPAYDLLSTDLYIGDDEQSALAINGKKNRLTLEDFKQLSLYLTGNEKVLMNIIKKFTKLRPKWEELIRKSFLSSADQDRLLEIISKKFEIFYIAE